MLVSLKRRAPWLLAALLAPLAAGCLPNATWLPDSSGFVYTGGPKMDQLIFCDASTGKTRVLVEKGVGPSWPAVSPDGKRIAVVFHHDDVNGVFLEVAVFDRDGKELHRSKKLEWAKNDMTNLVKQTAPEAFWIPNQDKLLLEWNAEAGFYDVKTKSSVKLDVNLAAFGASPIRPDGKGFLAYNKDRGYFVIDWDGKEKKIEMAGPEALLDKINDDSPLKSMLMWPDLHASRWDGAAAVVRWADRQVKIDPDKLTATVAEIRPALSEDKKIIQQQVDLAGGASIRVVELIDRYKKPKESNDPPVGEYRIEVLKPGEKAPKTVMDKIVCFAVHPSPDGKMAVVRGAKSMDALFEAKPGDDLLFLIDAKGEVAAKIDTAK